MEQRRAAVCEYNPATGRRDLLGVYGGGGVVAGAVEGAYGSHHGDVTPGYVISRAPFRDELVHVPTTFAQLHNFACDAPPKDDGAFRPGHRPSEETIVVHNLKDDGMLRGMIEHSAAKGFTLSRRGCSEIFRRRRGFSFAE